MHYQYRTRNVCARTVDFDLEDGTVRNVQFVGGCNGNLKAISKLIEGMPAEKVIDILRGNSCHGRSTSCADQLTIALSDALQQPKPATAN